MNEFFMSHIASFRYFIPPNILGIFTCLVLFRKHPVYVFFGFILFLMELHLHKFMILPSLFLLFAS